MHVTSLGFRTDLALLTASGSVVEDRGTHLVVRSPDNPSYFWGNFLLLARPPVPGGEREVVAAFHTEFPQADHVSIGIDTADLTDEARAAFEAAGMTVDVGTVLTASSLQAPREVEADVRPLAGDDEWEARARLSQQLYPQTPEDAFMTFARQQELPGASSGRRRSRAALRRLRRRRARLHRRHLRHRGRRRALPERRDPPRAPTSGPGRSRRPRGGKHALDHLDVRTLVIVADTDGDAIGIYRRLGFADAERQLMLEKRSGAWASTDA